MANKNIASKIWDIVNMVAFGLLLLGGLTFLLKAIFNWNIYNTLFGDSVTARVVCGVLGVASLVIFATILWKAFMPRKEIKVAIEDKPTRQVTPKPATANA